MLYNYYKYLNRYNKRAIAFNNSRESFIVSNITFSVAVHSSDLKSDFMVLEEEERGEGYNYPYRDIKLEADDDFEEYNPIYYQNILNIPTSGYVDAVFIYNNSENTLYHMSQERNPSLVLLSRNEIGCNSYKYFIY